MPRRYMAIALLLALLLVPLMAGLAAADTPNRLSADIIKAALRTAKPEEDGFVEHVVHLADTGVLPKSMLHGTFQWARRKPVRHRFQYFKRGLTIRAAKAGISI
jgi:hypothetical protein